MFHTNEQIIKHKVGLLNLAEELGNVSKACQVMGLSRDTFYRYKQAVEDGGVEALLHKDRRKPNPKNRVDERTEDAVLAYSLDFPAHGQVRASNELRKQGVFVSPSGVRSIWLRHKLACFKDRLKALEEKVAQEGIVLTEAQVAALEKKKHDDEVAGAGRLVPGRRPVVEQVFERVAGLVALAATVAAAALGQQRGVHRVHGGTFRTARVHGSGADQLDSSSAYFSRRKR